MTYDPNCTPDDDEFERAPANTIVSTGAIALGSLLVIATATLAVAHYVYDVPVYRRHGPGLANPVGLMFGLLILGVGGTFAICAGLYMRRRQ